MKDENVVTSGGRVLAVVALESTLEKSASMAKIGASAINFDGAFYRKDIAHKALKRLVFHFHKIVCFLKSDFFFLLTFFSTFIISGSPSKDSQNNFK